MNTDETTNGHWVEDAIGHALHSEQTESVISAIYPAVDAALWNYFTHLQHSSDQRLGFRRYELTSGSARYVLTSRAAEPTLDIASFMVQAASATYTYLRVLTTDTGANSVGILQVEEFLFSLFLKWFDRDQQQLQHSARGKVSEDAPMLWQAVTAEVLAQLGHLASVPRRRSRRMSWPEDDWAWEQVNVHHRNYTEVRAEWRMKQSPDRTLKDPDRSFRYAVDKQRKA